MTYTIISTQPIRFSDEENEFCYGGFIAIDDANCSACYHEPAFGIPYLTLIYKRSDFDSWDETPELNVVLRSGYLPTFHKGKKIYGDFLTENGDKIVGEFQRWGLPGFKGRQIINARAETVTEKTMFKRSIAWQRCVIPATGFYEWDSAKHKYFFQLPGQPIYLAGIYDNSNDINCFIILTTAPNESVSVIHDRMPLMLTREQVRPWLTDAGAALELLVSRPPLLQRTNCDGQLGFADLT